MKHLLLFSLLSGIVPALHAQYVYTINADSVKITNHCDTAELIIENHTQTVPGFLFNKGRGRTEFRKAMQKLDAYTYLIGGDTLLTQTNAWLQGGNTFGATGILGTFDNNHLDIYTNSIQRARFLNNGNLLLGGSAIDYGYKLQLAGAAGNIFFNPNLSTPDDRILIGGGLNTGDGQEALIRTSSDGGNSYTNILVERSGMVGIGNSNVPAGGWWVANPAIRNFPDGRVGIMSPSFYLGQDDGPYNSSRLLMTVSNTSEWMEADGYPNGQNNYYIGTALSGAYPGYKRAPLKISGRELHWLAGDAEAEAGRISESGNLLLGATTDNNNKLQVTGTTFSNYFTNSATPLGTASDGAIKLRWGGGVGSFIDFYNNGNTNLRGRIGSASDARPLYIYDQVGFSFINTPFVSVGSESGMGARFSVLNPQGSTTNAISIARIDAADATIFHYDMTVKSTGNVVVGSDIDNGSNFQVNGSSYFSGAVRCAGLTPDSSQTRVLVSDANGNIYYRNLSSWAVNGVVNTDLAVRGTLSAQQVKLMPNSWADYVFDKSYRLPSLPEVEKYIKQNNHLPGIPAAADVQQKGIEVGESQAALLKKIEELTLYAISQDKKLQAQDLQLQQQNKELENIKQQMKELKALIGK